MEKMIKAIFDLEHFEQNEKLERLIRETESRYSYNNEISDDDLEFVCAAGDSDASRKAFLEHDGQ